LHLLTITVERIAEGSYIQNPCNCKKKPGNVPGDPDSRVYPSHTYSPGQNKKSR